MSPQREEGSWARVAARNNAEWCDILCRAHGVLGRFDPDAWTAPRRTPPYYPDAVSLDPAAVDERIVARIDTVTPGCSVKDSFATLALACFGFDVVHEAEWIHRERRSRPDASAARMMWSMLEERAELTKWEAAWDVEGAHTGLFRPALLRHPSVAILGAYVDDSIVAGAILNRTEDTVGVSNLFSKDGDLDVAWLGCLGFIDRALPGLAVVGYEAGDALAAAHRQGFESVGELRIWLKE
jgi:hypothetical protein